MFLKCVLLLGQYVKVYGSLTARMYKLVYSIFDSRIVVEDSNSEEPNFVKILTDVFPWRSPLYI